MRGITTVKARVEHGSSNIRIYCRPGKKGESGRRPHNLVLREKQNHTVLADFRKTLQGGRNDYFSVSLEIISLQDDGNGGNVGEAYLIAFADEMAQTQEMPAVTDAMLEGHFNHPGALPDVDLDLSEFEEPTVVDSNLTQEH